MSEESVSRRKYIEIAGAAVVGLAVGLAGGYLVAPGKVTEIAKTVTETVTKTVTGTPPPPTAVHLDFTVWNYAVETIRDNAQIFTQKYPWIDVSLYDFNWPDFPSTMIKRFTQKIPTDVTYDGEDWLAQWAEAGWVVPLEDYWDKYETESSWSFYVNDMVPYAKSASSYKGKIYGLPYYSDMFTFLYNEKTLADNGYEPPKDWGEVLDISLDLKDKGVARYPFILEYEATNPFDWYCVLTGAYGRGTRLFDENLDTVFDTPGSPFIEHLNWLVDGIHKHNIINPDYLQSHETVVQKKLGAGEGVFTTLAKYNLAAMNTPGAHELAGQFRMSVMPGKTHECYGFAKMYNITKMCVDRGDDVIQAAISFIEYFGGSKGPVLKRWAVENALGFGFDSPWDDADIIAAFESGYGPGSPAVIRDQAKLAVCEPHPVWFGEWIDYTLKECVARALAQEISVDDCVTRMADRWKTLKAEAV